MIANRTLVLSLDDEDYNTIQKEIARRQLRRDTNGVIVPDGSSNLSGAILAECIRDLDEYRALYECEHPRGE